MIKGAVGLWNLKKEWTHPVSSLLPRNVHSAIFFYKTLYSIGSGSVLVYLLGFARSLSVSCEQCHVTSIKTNAGTNLPVCLCFVALSQVPPPILERGKVGSEGVQLFIYTF